MWSQKSLLFLLILPLAVLTGCSDNQVTGVNKPASSEQESSQARNSSVSPDSLESSDSTISAKIDENCEYPASASISSSYDGKTIVGTTSIDYSAEFTPPSVCDALGIWERKIKLDENNKWSYSSDPDWIWANGIPDKKSGTINVNSFGYHEIKAVSKWIPKNGYTDLPKDKLLGSDYVTFRVVRPPRAYVSGTKSAQTPTGNISYTADIKNVKHISEYKWKLRYTTSDTGTGSRCSRSNVGITYTTNNPNTSTNMYQRNYEGICAKVEVKVTDKGGNSTTVESPYFKTDLTWNP